MMHEQGQKAQGNLVVDRYCDKWSKIVHCSAANQKTMCTMFRKSVMKDAMVEMKDLQELLVIDFSKVGALAGDELDEAATWAKDHITPELACRTVVLIIAPLVESLLVPNGEAGERGRIEQKFRAKNFEMFLISLSGRQA